MRLWLVTGSWSLPSDWLLTSTNKSKLFFLSNSLKIPYWSRFKRLIYHTRCYVTVTQVVTCHEQLTRHFVPGSLGFNLIRSNRKCLKLETLAPRDKSHKQRAKNVSLLNIYAQRTRTTKKLFHLKMLKFLTINWYLPCLYLEVSSLKIAAGCCWTLLLLLKSQTCNSIFNANRRVQKSI